MIDLAPLLDGFATAVTPYHLALMVGGVLLGILVGVPPGLGAPNGVTLLMPLTMSDGVATLETSAGVREGRDRGRGFARSGGSHGGEQPFDVVLALMFGVVGYVLKKLGRSRLPCSRSLPGGNAPACTHELGPAIQFARRRKICVVTYVPWPSWHWWGAPLP